MRSSLSAMASVGRVLSGRITGILSGMTVLVIAALFMLSLGGSGCVAPSSSHEVECSNGNDCVPASCCHPTACVPAAEAPDCTATLCTMDCRPGTLDCGQGSCQCIEGECIAIFSEELS